VSEPYWTPDKDKYSTCCHTLASDEVNKDGLSYCSDCGKGAVFVDKVECLDCKGTGSTPTGTQTDSNGVMEQCMEPCNPCKSEGYHYCGHKIRHYQAKEEDTNTPLSYHCYECLKELPMPEHFSNDL